MLISSKNILVYFLTKYSTYRENKTVTQLQYSFRKLSYTCYICETNIETNKKKVNCSCWISLLYVVRDVLEQITGETNQNQ